MIQRGEIERLFAPVTDLIKNDELRTKVIDVWMLGIEEGGWKTMADLEAMPFTLLAETKGISFLEHTLAVTRGAIGLARAQLDTYKTMPYAVDMDRLVAGGLLHDVGKLLEIQPKSGGGYEKGRRGQFTRHPICGAILAARCGLGDDVVNTIACHAKEGEGAPKVLETVLIHQADFATFDPLVMQGKGQLL
jgi:putative nucleotidyltransferase with HDIG domain